MKATYSTNSPKESEKVATEFARCLKPGDVVALYGELGSGKTVFARGICRHFSVADWVKSPSFVLVREYPGSIPIYHIDLFRIEIDDPSTIIDDYLDDRGILIIEWAEKADAFLPVNAYKITISIENKTRRRIEIAASGD